MSAGRTTSINVVPTHQFPTCSWRADYFGYWLTRVGCGLGADFQWRTLLGQNEMEWSLDVDRNDGRILTKEAKRSSAPIAWVLSQAVIDGVLAQPRAWSAGFAMKAEPSITAAYLMIRFPISARATARSSAPRPALP